MKYNAPPTIQARNKRRITRAKIDDVVTAILNVRHARDFAHGGKVFHLSDLNNDWILSSKFL
jgi:hypothetical protein